MKHCLLLLCWLLANYSTAWAQRETANWRFGAGGAPHFPASGGLPVAVGGNRWMGQEASAVASDAAGNLLCYTDGRQVWDRLDQPMPNGMLNYCHPSATQGALLIAKAVSPLQYYLFTVDALENNLAGGLRYSLVDMSLRGGFGDVSSVKEVAVPIPGGVQLTEKLTAVRHANVYGAPRQRLRCATPTATTTG